VGVSHRHGTVVPVLVFALGTGSATVLGLSVDAQWQSHWCGKGVMWCIHVTLIKRRSVPGCACMKMKWSGILGCAFSLRWRHGSPRSQAMSTASIVVSMAAQAGTIGAGYGFPGGRCSLQGGSRPGRCVISPVLRPSRS
jgi:hypothetical protein